MDISFYDPGVNYATGGVLFNFRESGYYIYFPSLTNLLAALTECFRVGVYQDGENLDFDFKSRILVQYGRETQK